MQRKELLHVVEIRRGVLAEEIGGVGALVLLQREAREGGGRPLVQQHVPDILRVIVIAIRQSLDDVALCLMGAEREGLGLRQGDLAMGQGLFRLVAQVRKGEAALDGGGAQAGLGGEFLQRRPSCISLANADASSRGVRFSRWTFSTVARRKPSSAERPERMSTGTA